MVEIQPGEFVRVQVPAYLERSLQLALGAVHAPFFTIADGTTVAVVLRGEEWERLAPRFPSARPTAGFHLVSVQLPRGDSAAPVRLAAALSAAGLSVRLLPSFHTDQFLVARDELDRTVGTIRRLLEADPPR